jgi:hypothetical protein
MAITDHTVGAGNAIDQQVSIGYVGSGGWGYQLTFASPLSDTITSSFSAY